MSALSTNVLYEILKNKILSCERCLQQMEPPPSTNSPKFLDCSHTFCLSCLGGIIEGDDIFSYVTCPCCFEETTVGLDGVVSLPDNLTVIRIIDLLATLNENAGDDSFKNDVSSSNVLFPHYSHDSETSSLNHISDWDSGGFSIRNVRKSYLEHQQPMTTNRSVENDLNKTIVIECPPNRIGRLIGLRGATIKSIRSRTKCFVDIQKFTKASGDISCKISVSGSPDRVAEAFEMINNILKVHHSLEQAAATTTAAVLVSTAAVESGEISNFMASSHGSSNISDRCDDDLDELTSDRRDAQTWSKSRHDHSSAPCRRVENSCALEEHSINSNGEKETAAAGVVARQSGSSDSSDTTVEGGATGTTVYSYSDYGNSVRMECGLDRIGRLLGLKGGRIKSIRVRSGAKIVVTKDATCVIEISGTPDQIKLATTLVKDVLTRSVKPGFKLGGEDYAQSHTESCQRESNPNSCPEERVVLTEVGSNGHEGEGSALLPSPKSVSDVEDDMNADQDMDSSDRTTVHRSFSVDSQGNRPPLTQGNEVEEDWYCPHDKVAAIIGRRGTVIREIKRRTNCGIVIHNNIIDLPDKAAQRIVFRGLREQVSAAMSLIQAVIELGPVEGLQSS